MWKLGLLHVTPNRQTHARSLNAVSLAQTRLRRPDLCLNLVYRETAMAFWRVNHKQIRNQAVRAGSSWSPMRKPGVRV